jgi:hypothetical protein
MASGYEVNYPTPGGGNKPAGGIRRTSRIHPVWRRECQVEIAQSRSDGSSV